MHSRVFQLETTKKSDYDKENITLLNEFTLEEASFPNPNWIDWWIDSEDTPTEDFKWLCDELPEDVFEINKEEQSITLIKKPEFYVMQFVDKLKAECENITAQGLINGSSSTYKLKELLERNNCEFMVYNHANHCPIYLHEWLLILAKHGEVGTTYYLGGVIDYHY